MRRDERSEEKRKVKNAGKRERGKEGKRDGNRAPIMRNEGKWGDMGGNGGMDKQVERGREGAIGLF